MADQRFRLKRTGFGATLKSQHDPFRLKGTSDSTITVSAAPDTPGTRTVLISPVNNIVRIKR